MIAEIKKFVVAAVLCVCFAPVEIGSVQAAPTGSISAPKPKPRPRPRPQLHEQQELKQFACQNEIDCSDVFGM